MNKIDYFIAETEDISKEYTLNFINQTQQNPPMTNLLLDELNELQD